MSLCQYEWIEAAGQARCRNCGDTRKLRSLNTRRACSAASRDAPPADNAGCLHRGDVLRVEQCQTCQGKLEIPVYQCAVFGECTRENHARKNPQLASTHVCRGCPSAKLAEPALPGLATKAVNYAGAVARDRLNGRKRRSAELIERIFNKHCRVCTFYNSTEQACGKCGCPVNSSDPEANKLAWASEKCPDDRWPIQRANLIYYILPLRHPDRVWEWNVEQLRRRLSIFNGRRIVTIATKGPGERLGLEDPQKVIDAFGSDAGSIEFHLRPNDPHHWETPAFRVMLNAIRFGLPVREIEERFSSGQVSADGILLLTPPESIGHDLPNITPPHKSEATFYGHAKGVRRAIQTAVRPWTQAMYEHNLDRWAEVREILSVYPCCGIAKQPSRPVNLGDEQDEAHNWHFAGTFFWFQHAALFQSQRPWYQIADHSHSVEGYLATQFTRDESYCLAYESPGKVYSATTWARDARPKTTTLEEATVQHKTEIEELPVEIAPVRGKGDRPWEGTCQRKPWDYSVTAMIPELDTYDELVLGIELLRLQTVRPYIVVIDTGSTPENLARVELLRAQDLEVHSLRLNGMLHPSEFVTAALDLAFSICRTEYAYLTHTDVFPRRRDLISWLLGQCGPLMPAVGYELTPRVCPSNMLAQWPGMLGHTCTLLHMPTMDLIGAGWSMRRLARLWRLPDQRPAPNSHGWPDTECLLGHLLRERGIKPTIIGQERNFERTLDANIDHCRSLAGSKLYSPEHYRRAQGWADDARREALDRADAWRRSC